MKEKELEFLISQGEGYNLEFKESFSNSISRDICAFVNANGGKILLGVSDDGKIKGIKITNKLKSQVYDITRNFDPKFEISLEEVDSVLVIEVPEGESKPYSANGKFYLRYGPNSQQLLREEIREFFQKEGLILFDEKPNYDFDLEKDFDENKFRVFLEKTKISPVLKRKEILDNLSLLKDDYIKNAGVLLFCHRVTKFFLQATITCVLYQGKTKYKILDRKEFYADLYSNFQNAMLYLQSRLNTEFIIKGGPREERLELPEEALREALLNAIAHRDYFVSGANILVEIFSDRVEITNPGGLVKGITKKDLGKKSLSRNNLLFGLIQRMGLVEKVGSGIKRMKKAMKEYELNLKFDINDNWFTIIFKRAKKAEWGVEKGVERVVEKLSEKQKIIISLIRKNPKMSKEQIQQKGRLSKKSVEYNIQKLKERGLLRHVGPAKGGYWKVLEKSETLKLRYYYKKDRNEKILSLLEKIKERWGIEYELLDLSRDGKYNKEKERDVYSKDFKPRAKILKKRTGIPITKLRSKKARHYFISIPGTIAIVRNYTVEWWKFATDEGIEFLEKVLHKGLTYIKELIK